MDADTYLSLDALHVAIRQQVADQFSDLRTVIFYFHGDIEQLALPACLLELAEIEPALEHDAGTGQLPVLLRFKALLVFGPRDTSAELDVRKAAAALAAWLHMRRFPGVQTDPCHLTACGPDTTLPNPEHYAAWKIEWMQLAFLGENPWDNEGVIPDNIFMSFVPEIGQAHQDAYRQVAPDE
jgi:hypothetical protein